MSQERIEGLLQRGMVDDAMTECQAVLQVCPGNARVLGLLGMCLYRKQNYAAALEHFRRATLLDPQFVDAGFKLAQCLERTHQYAEAYDVAKDWLKVQPSHHPLRSLMEALRQHSTESYQGWERTATLQRNVQFNIEKEGA